MNRNYLPELLRRNISIVEPYPDCVAEVPTMLNLTAFFPGGKGLWLEEETNIIPSIMVLGQDFSTETSYLKMKKSGKNELGCPTWRNLLPLFKRANICISECFFTNVFMGLRKSQKETGKFCGLKDKEFVYRNLDYLKYQIDTIKPKAIITLGKIPTMLLAELSDSLKNWKKFKKYSDIKSFIVYNTVFNSHNCTCVSISHPSMRNLNLKYIRYENFIGDMAEVEMLKNI